MKPSPASYTCPSCDRFIDTHAECPYCGEDSPQRPLQRTLKLFAITLSLTGLVLLLVIARQSCPPSVTVAQLRPVMNHGRVTLTGFRLTSPGIKRPESAFQQAPQMPLSISFGLTDHTGQICVIAGRETVRNIFARSELTRLQAPIQVSGHLYLAAGKMPRLYLDSVKSLDQARFDTVSPL